jgi:hypothetical protein
MDVANNSFAPYSASVYLDKYYTQLKIPVRNTLAYSSGAQVAM